MEDRNFRAKRQQGMGAASDVGRNLARSDRGVGSSQGPQDYRQLVPMCRGSDRELVSLSVKDREGQNVLVLRNAR
jgi:hypothetical protein